METRTYPIPDDVLESIFPKCSSCGRRVVIIGGLKPHEIAVCEKCDDRERNSELKPEGD